MKLAKICGASCDFLDRTTGRFNGYRTHRFVCPLNLLNVAKVLDPDTFEKICNNAGFANALIVRADEALHFFFIQQVQ